MATIAVFLALGGVATAAFTLPKKSVGAKNLKKDAVTNPKVADAAINQAELANNAVTDPKVANGTLTAAKIAGGQVVKDIVLRETVVANIGNNGFQVESINCANGETAISGGGGFTPLGTRNYSGTEIGSDTRLISPVDANGDAIAGGQAPAGFLVSLQNVSGASRDYHGYVLCAQR
jgi:hypothetical protein